jgi:hypothetical protein
MKDEMGGLCSTNGKMCNVTNEKNGHKTSSEETTYDMLV